MSCCEVFTVSFCTEVIRVNTYLPPSSVVNWSITGQFEISYEGISIVDEDGSFEIDKADLPEGLLSPFGGDFVLRIRYLDGEFMKVLLARYYHSISFYVTACNPDEPKMSLGIPLIINE